MHNFAEEHDILVRTPGSLKTQEAEEMLLALDLDALVVAAYGLILPQKILQIPKLGCLNIHASILPRWRGAAPIQRAIMAGDGESGVCIMLMEKGLDTGPILKSETIILDDDTTGASLHDSLASIGAKLINPTLIDFADGKIEPTYQNDSNAVYAKKLSKEDGHLVWSKSAEELERIVRALNPWPGAWCLMNGERIKIHEASVLNTLQHTQDPGKILTGDFSVACGIGVLKITAIQQPGKSAMGVSDFIRGNPIQIGSTLL